MITRGTKTDSGEVDVNSEIEHRELEESNLEEDENEDEETNLDDDDENLEWDDSILVPSGSQGFSPDQDWGTQGDIPNVLRGLKNYYARQKSIFEKRPSCEPEQR